MEQKNYIGLVHKSLTGQLTDAEQSVYENWLLQPESNDLQEEMTEVWNIAADYKPTNFQPNTAQAFHKFKQAIKEESVVNTQTKVISINPFYRFARIAAALVLLVAAVFVFNNFNEESFNTHLQTANVIESSTLNDGTEIWLDKNSSLLVSEDFGKDSRNVKLEGKGYFNVKRDEAKPFIVQMGNNKLEVLGTSFNIDNSTEDVVVEVESGIVKINTKNAQETLKVGDVAVMNYAKDEIVVSKINDQKFDWYQSPMNINSVSISEAMDQIGTHYGVNISLSANVDRSCRLTSPLMQNVSIDEVFDVLQETYNLKYQKTGSKSFEIQLLNCK